MDQALIITKALSAVTTLWFLIVVPCWYLWHYLNEPLNLYRHEYLQGVGISLIMLAPVAFIVFLISRFVLLRRGK